MNTLPVEVRYSQLLWNCPLSEPSAKRLLDKLQLSTETAIVDIGCGWGELLLRAAQQSGAPASGIDTDDALLARGRASASAAHAPVQFANMRADDFVSRRPRAICIGSSHAFGGTRQMLEGLAKVVPQGRVLIGDMCWETNPSKECLDMFEDEVMPLSSIVALCRETGWKVMYVETATQQDWDAFECGHRAGTREWLVENASDARAADVEEELTKKEDGYFRVYRGHLGFVFAVLAR
ncbi:SAM-dependent methyltransferase [Akanthomyces lecanii RCEF 1005]|uniref:SAM-dependent methyltransferase n=1 Tax=Akanthomyces lecanii RCEF 1005 TaxID=1081108 RepID=A0A162KBG7_CORDF|nr:SAM-dependent methyltransferase [Akanthomyces lecanii RCEF 1005]